MESQTNTDVRENTSYNKENERRNLQQGIQSQTEEEAKREFIINSKKK